MDVVPKPLDSDAMFSGGAGMWLQYHDVVKPVYLVAIIKLLLSKETYGLPIDTVRPMSIPALVEWYNRRRYINPLRCLDYLHKCPPEQLDELLQKILANDPSLYTLAPVLLIDRLMAVYSRQHMSFPVYVYTEGEEPAIYGDVKGLFPGVNVTYLHGDLKKALMKCDNNFTYMVSDIELCKQMVEILHGSYAHVLLARDYRYNYTHRGEFKYDVVMLMREHPYIRLELNKVCDPMALSIELKKLSDQIDLGKENKGPMGDDE